jgi:hypothetical protein
LILLLMVIIFITILILIYIIKVKISIEYKINGLDDTFIITFSILRGIIKYRYMPKEKAILEKEKEEKKKSELDGAYEKIRNIIKVYRTFVKFKIRLRERLILKNLYINIDFGTGDAFYTGILSGVIWAFAGIIVSYISETFQTCERKININSKFSEKTIFGQLNCIFSVKIVYIILVTIKLLFEKFLKKIKIKGGDVSA